MAVTNQDQVGIQPYRVKDFALGLNTATPGTKIQDNEVRDLLNFEFDNQGNLSTRRGTTQLNANTFATRITSLHYFSADSGEVGILFTTAAKLFIVTTNGVTQTDLTGVLVFPTDTYWQWVTFTGIAIGVNKGTSGTNPVKVTTGNVASALGGSPPFGKYITTWNNRVWIADAVTLNRLWGSVLGNAEDWTTTTPSATARVQIDIEPNDGDSITGLWATKEVLYVFKRRRIFAITAFAGPNTDPANLRVDVYAKNIGCASAYSIQQVVNDVLFLSDQGVASLQLVQTAEDFKTAFYSRNIAEVEKFPKTVDEIPALLCDTGSQYWLSVPASVSLSGFKQTFVLDYQRLDEQIIRWTRFDGIPAGTAYTSFLGSTGKIFVIGSLNPAGTYQLYTYQPRLASAGFSDNGTAYTKAITTKSYNANVQLLEKYWHQWAIALNLFTSTAQIQIQYWFNQNTLRGGNYSFSLLGIQTGTLWAGGLWGPGLWGTQFLGAFDIVRGIKSTNFGKVARDITFAFSNSQNGEGFSVLDFMFWYALMTDKKVTDV